MTLVLETGGGLPNSNAFTDATAVTAFLTDRGEQTAWAALAPGEKDAAIIRATDYLRLNPRYRWLGVRKTYAQALPWPRTGVVERDGQAVADNVVPWQVAQATAYLAARMTTAGALATELGDLERGGRFTSESFVNGLYSYTIDASGAPVGTTIQYVDGLLMPLLRAGDSEPWDTVDTYQVLPELPDVLRSQTLAPDTMDVTTATDEGE